MNLAQYHEFTIKANEIYVLDAQTSYIASQTKDGRQMKHISVSFLNAIKRGLLIYLWKVTGTISIFKSYENA